VLGVLFPELKTNRVVARLSLIFISIVHHVTRSFTIAKVFEIGTLGSRYVASTLGTSTSTKVVNTSTSTKDHRRVLFKKVYFGQNNIT
jgi:hypothetical protein